MERWKCEVVENISAYLLDAGDFFVKQTLTPISNRPAIITGNSPYDAGYLNFTPEEKAGFIEKNPDCGYLFKKAVGANELLNGKDRWCLWIDDDKKEKALSIKDIKERVDCVERFRLGGGVVARSLAKKPHQFRYTNTSKGFQIVIPIVSSSSRAYIPVGYLGCNNIILSSAAMIANADLFTFGLIASVAHYDWAVAFSGRLGEGFRYLTALVYNTFPFPEANEEQKKHIEYLAEEILMVREGYPHKTLAELYDPDKMPDDLLKAHRELDRAVDESYKAGGFETSEGRLEHLLKIYEEAVDVREMEV